MKMADLKSQAAGRWSEIMLALSRRLTQDNLNGHKQPCPVCGGTKPFRVFSNFAETGGAICNHCGPFATGINVLMWLNNWDLRQTSRELERHLKMTAAETKFPTYTGQVKNPTEKKPKKERQSDIQRHWDNRKRPGEPLRTQELTAWAQHKPGISIATLIGSTVQPYIHGAKICVAFPASGSNGEIVGIQLARVDGQKFPASGKGEPRKYHTVSDSIDGWFAPFKRSAMLAAKRIYWCEGPCDAIAVSGILQSEDEVAVSNLCGASGVPKNDLKWMRDKEVIIASDADTPGIKGAAKRAKAAMDNGAVVRVIRPPYEVKSDHGMDMRDWIVDGAGVIFAILYELHWSSVQRIKSKRRQWILQRIVHIPGVRSGIT